MYQWSNKDLQQYKLQAHIEEEDCEMLRFAYTSGPVLEESLVVICAAQAASKSSDATQM